MEKQNERHRKKTQYAERIKRDWQKENPDAQATAQTIIMNEFAEHAQTLQVHWGSLENMQKWAEDAKSEAYAIDDAAWWIDNQENPVTALMRSKINQILG